MTRWLTVGLVLILALAWWVLRSSAPDGATDDLGTVAVPGAPPSAVQLERTRPDTDPEPARPSLPLEVVDAATGEPLQDARVGVAWAGAGAPSWRTDPTGRVDLDGWDGTSDLEVSAEEAFDGSLSADAWRAALARGVPRVALQPRGRLELRIVDEAGQAADGVQLLVHLVEPTRELRALRSWPVHGVVDPGGAPAATRGAAGPVVITDLPCGVPLRLQWDRGASHGTRELTIPAGTRVLGEDLVLSSAAVVVGRLVDAAGAPLADQAVTIETSWGPGASNAWCRTDDDGHFRALGVVLGAAVLVVQDTTARHGFEVVPPLTDLGELVIEAPVEVTGVVIDGGLPPQPRWAYQIEALCADGHLSTWMSEAESRFSIRVPSGPTVLLVRPGRSTAWVDPGVLARVEVTAPASEVRVVLARPSGQLVGRLPAGVDVESVDLSLFPALASGERGVGTLFGSMPFAKVPVEQGRFVLGPLTPGSFDVHVRCPGQGSAWLVGVDVRPGGMTDLGTLTVGRGRLQRAADDQTSTTGVVARTVVPSGLTSPVEAAADEVVELEAGPWLLFPRGVPAGRSHGHLLDVRPGELLAWRGDLWSLESPGRLRGMVLQDGVPRSDVEVVLSTLDRAEALGSSSRVGARRTDGQGRFSFGEVLPGAYLLSLAGHSGQEVLLSTVAVAADKLTEVSLDLPSATTTLHLLAAGESLDRVAKVALYWREGGRTRHWVGYPAGPWVDVPAVPGRAWLAVYRGPAVGDARSYGYGYAVPLEGLAADRTREVLLPDNGVVVSISERATRPPEPTLRLGFDGDGASVDLQWRPTRLADGRQRCGGLPVGATLELAGRDMDGAAVQRDLVVPVGELALDWP